ncbi:MAG TPA: histidinol-phosphate transaminase [Gemmatimonas sp.]|nr:histidinol-phosphate transaminase [Gemmatimonas sp.]
MPTPVNRRQWLISSGIAAGTSMLAPTLLPAIARTPGGRARSYGDALLQMEAEATAARRAAGPIRLASNENPFGMSPKAKEAITNGWFEHNQYGLKSEETLRRAFAAHVGVDPAYVLVTQGSSETLAVAALAFGLHGGEVVTPWPTFEGLPRYAEAIGAIVHKVPLDDAMGHDFAALDARVTNAVNLVFVCNPNNPTGTLAGAQQIRSFVSATQHRALVLVDEAYHDFVDDASHRSMIDLVLKGENVIISRTASKLHGIAGLRVGFAIARPDVVVRMRKFMTGNPNAFGMHAAIASLADTQYQDFVKARNREGRAMMTETLRAMGRKVTPSHTNFVFFDVGMPVERFQAAMRAQNFLVGRAFPPYGDWCRVSIGTPDEMKAFVAALPATLRA